MFLWLDVRDAVESKGTGVLVGSQSIRGIGVAVVFRGSWGTGAHWETKAEKMETADK